MAKISKILAAIFLQPAWALVAMAAVPDDGIRAEGEKRWGDAIKIYQSAIAADSQRADLWLRIADIEAVRGNAAAAADATRQAATLSPRDAALHFRLAQACAVAKQPERALEAIDRALDINPKNMDYLRARVQYANWMGKDAIVEDSFKRMIAISSDDDLLLFLARARTLAGKLDEAASDYRTYVEKQPKNDVALMEYIKVENWRGNSVRALALLDEYRRKFGTTVLYRQQRARVLALAGQPTPALELADLLVKEDPANYDSRVSHTVALKVARRTQEAVDGVKILGTINPAVTASTTDEIRRFVGTDLRHQVMGGFDYYTESDSVRILRYYAQEAYQLNPKSRLLAGQQFYDLTADKGSGLENIDGGRRSPYWHGWLGISHRFNPEWDAELHVGVAEADRNYDTATYRLLVGYQPLDNLKLKLDSSYDYFTVSPRAASLGIRRQANSLQTTWRPDLNYTVESVVAYDWLSDDNRRWEAQLAPRRSILRSQYLNLDVGPAFSWHGFSDDPVHGYYSPSVYQRYAMNAYILWKISGNDSVGITLSAGTQRDEDSSFEFGAGSDIEAVFGISRDWMLRLCLSLMSNGNSAAGGYNAQQFSIQLTRRF